jgi:signal transduction histidine kinase
MALWQRPVYAIGDLRAIVVLGASYIVFATGRSFSLTAAESLSIEPVPEYLMVVTLGGGLAYGGYRVSNSDLDPALFPRAVAWSLGGFGLMLGVLGVITLTSPTGLDRPIFSSLLATALGSVGGFAVGVNEIRALSRARDAERARTDLKETVERLERQNERLDTFASFVSHDLRNPLHIAAARLELAREDCDSDHLAEVAKGHERMYGSIDDLLRLARHGVTETDTEPVELTEVIRDQWRTLRTADATLTVDTGCTIRADRSQLRHLLENLIQNAIDHGGDDVSITVGELDGERGFYVADDGPGIPEAERDRVFEPGYSTAREGAGIGIVIVQEVAEAHGWEITVTGGEETGARFEIDGVDFVQR